MANMSFEKIDRLSSPDPAPTIEHPAACSARLIRELFEQNIALIDGGHVFTRDGEDVSAEIREASLEQMVECDRVIERASHMDPSLYQPAAMVLRDLQEVLGAHKLEETKKIEEPAVPEIGNYDHKKD